MILFMIYLLKVSGSILALFLIYYLLFRNNTFHQANRMYLLFVILFSFAVPLISVTWSANSTVSIISVIQSPYSDLSRPVEELKQQAAANTGIVPLAVICLYLIGVIFLSYRFIKSVIALQKLGRQTSLEIQGKFRIKRTDLKKSFTFLNSIFLPKEETGTIVLQHEQAHLIQYHWIDLLVAEIASIILWFNPVLRSVKNELRLQHEFLADRAVIANGITFEDYAQCLVKNMGVEEISISPASSFYSSSIKKRIVMLTKNKTSIYQSIVYLFMIPACAMMAMSFGKKQNVAELRADQTGPDLVIQNIPDIAPVDLTKVTTVVLYGGIMDPATKKMRNHRGIDFKISEGSDVVATADGIVIDAKYNAERGNHVLIKHGDTYSSQYSHLKTALVKKGERITKGQVIGFVGNTGLSRGPHLHYEILKNGTMVDPKDYLPKLPGFIIVIK